MNETPTEACTTIWRTVMKSALLSNADILSVMRLRAGAANSVRGN